MKVHFVSRPWGVGAGSAPVQYIYDILKFEGRDVSLSLVNPRSMSGCERGDYVRVLGEIDAFKADWVVFAGRGHSAFIEHLHSWGSSGRVVLWDPDEIMYVHHTQSYTNLKGKLDLIIQEHKGLAEMFSNCARLGAVWLPACFERYMEPTKMKRVFDIGFLGYVCEYRAGVIDRLLRKTGVTGLIWDAQNQGLLRGTGAANHYAQCRISLGLPRLAKWPDCEWATSNRIFHALGTGSFYLNSYVRGMELLFTPGKHLVEWKTEDELAEKVLFYLEHEEERNEIAEAGRKMVYKYHLSDYRAVEFWEILESRMSL